MRLNSWVGVAASITNTEAQSRAPSSPQEALHTEGNARPGGFVCFLPVTPGTRPQNEETWAEEKEESRHHLRLIAHFTAQGTEAGTETDLASEIRL